MLDTGQFRFSTEIYKSKDEANERKIANRRLVRGLGLIIPLLIVVALVSTVFLF